VSRCTLPAAALAAAGIIGVLSACEADVAPSAPASDIPISRASFAASPTPGATRSPLASGPDFSSLVDLGLELEIGVLGREHTAEMLDFVSDGQAILYSSGIEPDVTTTSGAPDLWRIEPFGEPELVWRNPHRDHSLARLGGDAGTYAFVDIPLTGERAWTLYLIPRRGQEAMVLDRHPGDEDVPSFVPSFSVHERRIVWTAFDRGPDGPVSQLLTAAEPTWEPELLLEHPAQEVEIWLPSQNGADVAYTEVRYSEDRDSDERSVWLMPLGDPAATRRLDATGRATMPVLIPDAVLWKQADRGYNMFNWGRMYRHDLASARVDAVDLSPQTYVNYPSGGQRYAAWWGSDSFSFGVYDHVLDEPRLIERNPPGSDTGVLRPHIAAGLLAWLRVVGSDEDAWGELRYAWMPDAAEVRDR
jgi:hypothetical protein